MSAAAAFPLESAGRPVIFWSRSPQRRGHLRGRGLTRLDKDIESQINKCLEDGEYPSVPKLALYCECTERAVYNSLNRLEAAGAIERESIPGLPSVYRMPHEYRGKTATPERAFTGTPERAFRGSPPVDDAIPRAPAEMQETTEKRTAAAACSESLAAAPSTDERHNRAENASVGADTKRLVDMPDPETVRALTDRGIEPRKARELARMGTERVSRNIALAYRRNHRDIAAWLVRAIENDYARPPVVELKPEICRYCNQPVEPGCTVHDDCYRGFQDQIEREWRASRLTGV